MRASVGLNEQGSPAVPGPSVEIFKYL